MGPREPPDSTQPDRGTTSARRSGPAFAVLLACQLTLACATWTPEPPADPSVAPPRLFYEKMMFGPDGMGKTGRVTWLSTIGLVSSPFWGLPLAYDVVSRGVESGRLRTRYDDPRFASFALDPDFEFGAYHAVVIGNANYQRLDRLVTPATDADEVATTLRDLYGFETTAIHDATRTEMIRALVALRGSLAPRDNLLIYYAGHGLFDEEVNEGYWLPVDADFEDPSTWLATTTVSTMLRGMRAKHVLIVADSCYSGGMTRDVAARRRAHGYIYELARKPARMVLASGGLEPVQDEGGGSNSVFAKYFLAKLRENRLPVLEGSKLFLQIREPVMENAFQTPEYAPIRFAGHGGGDFLFLRRGAQ